MFTYAELWFGFLERLVLPELLWSKAGVWKFSEDHYFKVSRVVFKDYYRSRMTPRRTGNLKLKTINLGI
jgi:hypothetical protein